MPESESGLTLPFDVRRVVRDAASASRNLFGLDEPNPVTLRPAPGVRVTRSRMVPPAGLAPATGSYVQRAGDLLSQLSAAAGLEPASIADLLFDPNVVATSTGAHVVHSRQVLHGIPVFQAAQSVVFAPDDTVSNVAADTVIAPEGSADQARKVGAFDALRASLRFLSALPVDGTDAFGQPRPAAGARVSSEVRTPPIIAQFEDHPDLPTVFDPGELGTATLASLVWLAADDGLALCWQLLIAPDPQRQYRILVDVTAGAVTYCMQTTRDVAARGTVFRTDPREPAELLNFPAAVSIYNISVPVIGEPDFPRDWVSVDATEGIFATAYRAGDQAPLRGQVGPEGVTFSKADPSGLDQAVLNAFYLTCIQHDLLYTLGFREADGNFQQDNFGQPGAASDRVRVSISPGTVWATASMTTPADGVSPLMNLGIAANTGRHTAFDASVIFHEATHGLTLRLVGGGLNTHALEAPQSAGMSEGWSDFVSCQLLESEVIGAWLVDKAAGVRSHPYDAGYPGSYASLGEPGYTEMHGVGEIWCATLMDLARVLGRNVILPLLVDALKLTPASPSFADGRDALLLALEHERAAGLMSVSHYSECVQSMWRVFASRGLGTNAGSDGSLLRGIIADFTTGTSSGSTSSPTWSDWSVDGPSGTVPAQAATACVANGSSARTLYVVGGDGAVYFSANPDGSGRWSNWKQTGPAGTVPPLAGLAAVSSGDGVMLWTIGTDGGLYWTSKGSAGGPWSSWARTGPTGTPPRARIAAYSVNGGQGLAVYTVGGDGFPYSSSRTATGEPWSPWKRLDSAGAVGPSAASAVAVLGDSVAAFAVSADGMVYTSASSGGGPWGIWRREGPTGAIPSGAAITACSRDDGRVELFCIGADGLFYRAVRGASSGPTT